MYDIGSLPRLIRKNAADGEANFPQVPDLPPDVVAVDPGRNRQWLKVMDLLGQKSHEGLAT